MLRSYGLWIYADLPSETTQFLFPLTAGCISGIACLLQQQNKKPLFALSSLCVSYSPYFSPLNPHLLESGSPQLLCRK